jgi:hypothetical protein
MYSVRSIRITFSPSSAAKTAAAMPPAPVPSTARSKAAPSPSATIVRSPAWSGCGLRAVMAAGSPRLRLAFCQDSEQHSIIE